MNIMRTRFGKDIVGEFLPPTRATKKQRVVIMCDGAPSLPSKKQLLEFFSKKGFWVIHFRYRGSWESDGVFLKDSPHLDVLTVIEQLPKGFVDLWNNKKYKLAADQIILLTSSFGGPAVILASPHPKINKVIAVSPLINWQHMGPAEPYPKMIRFFEEAFGNGYRFAQNGWDKLKAGNFYNPIKAVKKVNGTKLLFIHAKDDRTCPYNTTKRFAEATGAKLVTLPRGDHLSSSIIMQPRFYKIFKQFINQKP
jgi:pimeloyl-ACP methyl ester carboxylesterase